MNTWTIEIKGHTTPLVTLKDVINMWMGYDMWTFVTKDDKTYSYLLIDTDYVRIIFDKEPM